VRFDPAEWSAIYDSPQPSAPGFVFRRGASLAIEACLARAESGERWVDVGTGTGHLAERIAAAGLEVTGVDRDERMVDAAWKRCTPEAQSNGLRFAVAEADRLPFPDETVDGVIATALVGLLPDPASFLREVHRVLRPRGSAVITFSNRSSVLHGLGMKARVWGPDRSSRRYAAPARRYTLRQAVLELQRAGLATARTYHYNFFFVPGGRMLPPRNVALFLEPRLQRPIGALLARNLLTVAVKC
jgi:ubiquinone/menaquinone biosynthesis C-methylase UbiE